MDISYRAHKPMMRAMKGKKSGKPRVCISLTKDTKNRLKSMGSKGDSYDDVINGLIDLLAILSKPEVASSVAKELGMSDDFIDELKEFSKTLQKRGEKYRNCDYEAQKLLLRLDLLN